MQLTTFAAALAMTLAAQRSAGAVEGGTPDRASTFAVAIATGGPAAPMVRCSGTLVSPHVVLTARHCIAGTSAETARCEGAFPRTPGAPTDLWVTAAATGAPSLSWKQVSSWTVPAPNRPCGADLALLVLAEPISSAEATPATVTVTEDEFQAAAHRRVIGISGFGSSTSAGTDPGVRRSRFDVPVRCVPDDPAFPCGDERGLLDASELATGAGACTGDSGAGAIVAGTSGTIFGVLSRSTRATGACGEGIFERTDLWRWLIAKTVLEATPAGEIAPPWATSAFPGAPGVGDLCRDDTCRDGASCVSFDAARSYVCAAHCETGCADGTHCENDLCAPGAPPASSSTGCAAAPSGTEGSVAMLIALVAVVVRLRRRQGSSRSSSRRLCVAGGAGALGAPDGGGASSRVAVSLAGGKADRGVPTGRVEGGGGGRDVSTERSATTVLAATDGVGGGIDEALAAERSSCGAAAASIAVVLRETRTP